MCDKKMMKTRQKKIMMKERQFIIQEKEHLTFLGRHLV